MKSLKRVIRLVFSRVYFVSGMYRCVHKGSVVILMYHRVLDSDTIRKDLIQPGMYVSRNTFKKHVSFLAANYNMISFQDFLKHLNKNYLNPEEQYCIITFDDGWKDNYYNAFPTLKEYKVPATIFLVSSFLEKEGDFWVRRLERLVNHIQSTGKGLDEGRLNSLARKWLGDVAERYIPPLLFIGHNRETKKLQSDLDKAIEWLKKCKENLVRNFIAELEETVGLVPSSYNEFLDWEEVKEMSSNGISFGSHGVSHRILTSCSFEEMRREIEQSHVFLSSKGTNYVPVFSYPNGNTNSSITQLVKHAGYQAAVTTCSGTNGIKRLYPFHLNRISIHEDVSTDPQMFAFHISRILSIANLRKREHSHEKKG